MTNEQFDKAKMLTRHNKMLCLLLLRNGNLPGNNKFPRRSL